VGEVESVLGTGVYPITWPIFRAGTFRGVYHRLRKRVYLFDKEHANSSSTTGAERPPVEVTGIDDPVVREALDERGYDQLRHDAELLDAAGDGFHEEKFLAGELSPMFFGSAVNNFGLEAFLETFCELMPPPRARPSDAGRVGTFDPLYPSNHDKLGHQDDDRRRWPLALDALDEPGDLAARERPEVHADRWPEARADDGQVLPQGMLARQPVGLVREQQRDPLLAGDPGNERRERPGRGVRDVEILQRQHHRSLC